jgi:hypothetical protein
LAKTCKPGYKIDGDLIDAMIAFEVRRQEEVKMKTGKIIFILVAVLSSTFFCCAATTPQVQTQPQTEPQPQYQPPAPQPSCEELCEQEYNKCEYECDTTTDEIDLDYCNGWDGYGICEVDMDACMDECGQP